MTQTFIQVGNSKGVIIPKALFEELGVSSKQEIWIEPDKVNKSFIIHTQAKSARQTTPSPRFLTLLEKVNKEYGPALKKLANL